MRVCPSSGCPNLVTKPGRCPTCRREREQARGTRQQRGYDTAYDNERKHYANRMARGERFTCWSCTKPIDTGQVWHLGHCVYDRNLIHGPQHAGCNLDTSSRDCTHASHM